MFAVRRSFGVVPALVFACLHLGGRASAQIAPVPGVGYEFVFDDMFYSTELSDGTYDIDTHVADPGTIVGVNDWFVPYQDGQLYPVDKVAWYLGNLGNNGHSMAGIGVDDGDEITRIETDRARGMLRFAINKGSLAGNDIPEAATNVIDLVSGFKHRTGTWLLRVRLPDFEGTKDFLPIGGQAEFVEGQPYCPVPGENCSGHRGDYGDDADLHFSFWASAWDFRLETRDVAYQEGSYKDGADWNWEINNWYGHRSRYDGEGNSLLAHERDWSLVGDGVWSQWLHGKHIIAENGDRIRENISTSVLAGFSHLLGRPLGQGSQHQEFHPLIRASDSIDHLGQCYAVDESGSGSRYLSHGECLHYLTGARSRSSDYEKDWNGSGQGDNFVYLLTRITPSETTFELVAQEEWEFWSSGQDRGRFVEMDGVNHIWAKSSVFKNYVTPRPVSNHLMMAVGTSQGDPRYIYFGYPGFEEEKIVDIDYLFYTPETDLSIYQVIDDVRKVRYHLWSSYNSSIHPKNRIWRVNTVQDNPWASDNYIQRISGTAGYCTGFKSGPSKPWDYELEHSPNGDGYGGYFIQAVLKNDETYGYRWVTFVSKWIIYHWDINGNLISNKTVFNHGSSVRIVRPSYVVHRTSVEARLTQWGDDGERCNEFENDDYRIDRFTDIYWDSVARGAESGVTSGGMQPLDRLELLGPAPNPSTGLTSVTVGVPDASWVTVSLLDMMGREVERILEGEYPRGYRQINFSTRRLAAGVYVLRVRSDNEVVTRRLTILR